MPFLTRDQILEANDIQTEVVPVPEWGGEVMVYGLSGAERDALEEAITQSNGKKREVNLRNIRAKMAAWSVRDEGGQRLFSDKDIERLGKKSAAALDRVFSVASRLSGISKDDVEELAKNSESGQSSDSGTA